VLRKCPLLYFSKTKINVVYCADKIVLTGMSSKCNMVQLDGLLVQLLAMHKRSLRRELLLALVMEAFRFVLHNYLKYEFFNQHLIYSWIWFLILNVLQVTAQDVSTMLRCGQKTIIFLINNGGYTIEVEIHDGPYNVIKNWNYTGLIDAIHNGEGKCWTTKASLLTL
jgi:hypothetical protein